MGLTTGESYLYQRITDSATAGREALLLVLEETSFRKTSLDLKRAILEYGIKQENRALLEAVLDHGAPYTTQVRSFLLGESRRSGSPHIPFNANDFVDGNKGDADGMDGVDGNLDAKHSWNSSLPYGPKDIDAYYRGKKSSPFEPLKKGVPFKRKKPDKHKFKPIIASGGVGGSDFVVPHEIISRMNGMHQAITENNAAEFERELRLVPPSLRKKILTVEQGGSSIIERVLLESRSPRFLRHLLEAGVDPNFAVKITYDGGFQDEWSMLAVVTARDENDYGPVEAMIDLLLQDKANVHGKSGHDALMNATLVGAKSVVKMLTAAGARFENKPEAIVAGAKSGSKDTYTMAKVWSGIPVSDENKETHENLLISLFLDKHGSEWHVTDSMLMHTLNDNPWHLDFNPATPPLGQNPNSVLYASIIRANVEAFKAVLTWNKPDFWSLAALEHAAKLAEHLNRVSFVRAIKSKIANGNWRQTFLHPTEELLVNQLLDQDEKLNDARLVQIIQDNPWKLDAEPVKPQKNAAYDDIAIDVDALDGEQLAMKSALFAAIQRGSLPVLKALLDFRGGTFWSKITLVAGQAIARKMGKRSALANEFGQRLAKGKHLNDDEKIVNKKGERLIFTPQPKDSIAPVVMNPYTGQKQNPKEKLIADLGRAYNDMRALVKTGEIPNDNLSKGKRPIIANALRVMRGQKKIDKAQIKKWLEEAQRNLITTRRALREESSKYSKSAQTEFELLKNLSADKMNHAQLSRWAVLKNIENNVRLYTQQVEGLNKVIDALNQVL